MVGVVQCAVLADLLTYPLIDGICIDELTFSVENVGQQDAVKLRSGSDRRCLLRL